MKRIALFVVLACGCACAVGCGEVKRRVEEGARGELQHAADVQEQKARDAVRNAGDSAADSATKSDADAKKRDKLKGNGDDDK